ncbi:MAG: hypothetical protein OXU42_16625 [Deltaproteobacteria bacterium]|nr:hypothetical protein [Deltaproteobacteria bacterium]
MRIEKLKPLATLIISLGLLFAVGLATAAENSTSVSGRLLVGDGETSKMSIIDLKKGTVQQDAFDMGSRAGRIYATKSGRYALAVSSDANTVHVFDGGIYLEKHGDHFDRVSGPVKQIDVDLTGERPVHLYVSGKWSAIFYDGSGDVVLLNEEELEKKRANYKPPKLNAGAHHGGAVPLAHDLFAVTLQHPDFAANPKDYRLPIGAKIVDLSGKELHRQEGCKDLHGDAGNGHVAAFACRGGVLTLEADHGKYKGRFIPFPEGVDKELRLTAIWGYSGLDHFFPLGSAAGVYAVDAKKGVMKQLVSASDALKPVNAGMSHDGKALLVVMSDGELRKYDTRKLDLLASARDFLATPVETGFWARPHVTTIPGAVFITDSVGGKVLQLDDKNLKVVKSWKIAGNPTKVAFVGIMGKTKGH